MIWGQDSPQDLVFVVDLNQILLYDVYDLMVKHHSDNHSFDYTTLVLKS